jgi:hypothetical protein
MDQAQGSLFDLYRELTQPEDCVDCASWLDVQDLKVSWDYCDHCARSLCVSCSSLHACDAMLKSRPHGAAR